MRRGSPPSPRWRRRRPARSGLRLRGHPRGGGNTSSGQELFIAEVRQLPHARRRRHEGTGRAEPRRRVPSSRAEGFGEATIRGRRPQPDRLPDRRPPTGAPGMPANLVTGAGRGRRRSTSPRGRTPCRRRRRPAERARRPAGPRPVAGQASRRRDDLHLGRLRRLPHARRTRATSGTIGPNLDEAKPRKELAVERVTNGGGAMPVLQGPAQRRADRGRRRLRRRRRRQVERSRTARRQASRPSLPPRPRDRPHVRDRHARSAPRAPGHDAPLEPVRPALGMRRDHDLVGAEGAQRVLHRLQRIAVADLAARLDAGRREPRERASSRSCAAARAPSSSETQC